MSATPLLQQYFAVKEQYRDALVLFQVGDFYELFFDDAKTASSFLGIALTKRGMHEGKPVPLCGVPVHALDHYLVKLVRGGFRVVLCDQKEQVRGSKLFDRVVTQVLTPGTLTDMRMLDDKSASYCAALFPTAEMCGCAFVEILTGQFFVTVFPVEDRVMLEAELRRFSPDEVLIPDSKSGEQLDVVVRRLSFATARGTFNEPTGEFSAWIDQIPSSSWDLAKRSEAVMGALGLLYSFLQKNQSRVLEACSGLFFYAADDYLMLDGATQRNLEIVKNAHDGSEKNTLFSVLDQAITPMGARMIKKWLVRPLVKKSQIEARHEAIEFLHRDFRIHDELALRLRDVGDFERIVGRIVLRRAQLYDYQALTRGLEGIESVRNFLIPLTSQGARIGLLQKIVEGIADFTPLKNYLISAINLDQVVEGKIGVGFSVELDRLRHLAHEGTSAIAEFEQQERERTGINSLKVKFNRVQGYAIEITKANLDAVPADYLRIQTLVNGERFTTQALKNLEQELLSAQRQTEELEEKLFMQICADVEQWSSALRRVAQSLAQCDALVGLTRAAYEFGFVRPVMHEGAELSITGGRHPVVAAALGSDFVANDVRFDERIRTWVITGPNMGGKSTFLRQVALVGLMAQAGSFVPASHAFLPIFDRVFTRIGATDNVAAGKSTFLVEMEETALICNRATCKSLVVLDEVGRGTSTYDGLAIAQAVVEYLHYQVHPFALFATHFHELTALAQPESGIVAYHAASVHTPEGMILLHKIVPGCADGSFGIEVAKQVDLPAQILQRAQALVAGMKQE